MTRPFDVAARQAEVGGFWPISGMSSDAAPSSLVVRRVSNRDIATAEGWTTEDVGGKYRYAWALGGRRDKRILASLGLPYPKHAP